MQELGVAFQNLFGLWPMFCLVLGVTSGIFIGAIPGLSAGMLVALSLPLTYGMDSVNAIILLVGMYVGGISGGMISSTLLRMPGTPASIMATFDGYPMAQKGEPGRVLGVAISASVTGGLISWIVLALLSPPLARVALEFGPWEYFALVLTAVVMIASISEGSLVKGLIAGVLGMLCTMPGLDPSLGRTRLTFGFQEMTGGFHLLPVLIGVFVLSQLLKDIVNIERKIPPMQHLSRRGMLMKWREWKEESGNLVRSSLIGTWVGILPGIGANIASMLSYSAAKNASSTPEKFGTGHRPGLVSAEAANNASIGGALIPLITMGIPGSVMDAILIGALVMHNLQPGPLLFTNNPEIAYGVISSYLVANIIMFAVMIGAIGFISRIVYVPKALLLPTITLFVVIGTFAVNNRFFDVWTALAFGAIGYVLERQKIPLGPFIIGFVLAPIAELHLRQALMLSAGSVVPLFERPIALAFLALTLATLLWPTFRSRRQARRAQVAAVDKPEDRE